MALTQSTKAIIFVAAVAFIYYEGVKPYIAEKEREEAYQLSTQAKIRDMTDQMNFCLTHRSLCNDSLQVEEGWKYSWRKLKEVEDKVAANPSRRQELYTKFCRGNPWLCKDLQEIPRSWYM